MKDFLLLFGGLLLLHLRLKVAEAAPLIQASHCGGAGIIVRQPSLAEGRGPFSNLRGASQRHRLDISKALGKLVLDRRAVSTGTQFEVGIDAVLRPRPVGPLMACCGFAAVCVRRS